jgi:hypothetical protein
MLVHLHQKYNCGLTHGRNSADYPKGLDLLQQHFPNFSLPAGQMLTGY